MTPPFFACSSQGARKAFFLLVQAQDLAMTATPAITVGIGRSSAFPELSSYNADLDLVSAESQDPSDGQGVRKKTYSVTVCFCTIKNVNYL